MNAEWGIEAGGGRREATHNEECGRGEAEGGRRKGEGDT